MKALFANRSAVESCPRVRSMMLTIRDMYVYVCEKDGYMLEMIFAKSA